MKSQTETEINAAGPHISETQVATLFEQLHVTTAEDIVVVAGSVPASLPDTIYIDIAKIAQQTGAKLVVDAEKSLIRGFYRIILYLLNQISTNLKQCLTRR